MADLSVARPLDFLVIGAHKAGTTSLFQYLYHHPEIFLPAQKELPFFTNDGLFEQGWDRFAREYFDLQSTKLLGKITPQYMKEPWISAPRIQMLMPEVKLIAILRNPIDRAYSHYRMAVQRGWKSQSAKPFRDVVFESIKISGEALNRWKPTNCVALGLYGKIMNCFMEFFPSERMLVLFSDDLERRPQSVLDSILSFLGLPQDYSPQNIDKKYHVGGNRQRFPFLRTWVRKMKPLHRIWLSIPKPKRQAFKMWWHAEANVVSERTTPLEMDLRKMLAEFYEPDVRQLERIIGRSVPWNDFHPEINR
jgi:hypothetical protein